MPAKIKLTPGQILGNWKITRPAESIKGRTAWYAVCTLCGSQEEHILTTKSLRENHRKSCGCADSLIGKSFGRLTVTKKVGKDKRGNILWECTCSCNTENPKTKIVPTYALKMGKVKSCGCLVLEARRARIKNTRKSKYTIDIVREYAKQHGCQVISKEYVGLREPMEFVGSCGHHFTRPFYDFMNKELKTCPKCSYHNSMNDRRIPYEKVKEEIESHGVTLLSKEYTNNHTNLKLQCKCEEKTIFYRSYKTFKTLNAYFCDKCSRFTSRVEQEITNYVKSLGIKEVITRDNLTIKPYQIDISIPEKKVMIEVNGIYWHSELSGGKDRWYHRNKWQMCRERGYKLIFITDYEWENKKNKIQGYLKSLLGKNTEKVHARECSVVLLDTAKAKEFTNNNHLQGFSPAKYYLGLQYNGDIVALMSFGVPRYNTRFQYELLRYCSKIGLNVNGGANKIFKEFIRNYSPKSIVSYCDISKFTGEMYENLGFKLTHYSNPNYVYVKAGKITEITELFSRQKFQKHKLSKLLEIYDENLSEWENMQLNGYDRYWDCGNAVYVWNK
jgi:very-short-patch-repair endonuclease